MYDLIIIGAGVSGCCIAREISRYKIKACVIEKGDDVASGTSKANTGVIHTGLEAPPGSLMAELCVRGNELMYEWAKDLNFPAEKNGKLIVCTHEEDMPLLYEQLEHANANGVPECEILDREEVLKREQDISDSAPVHIVFFIQIKFKPGQKRDNSLNSSDIFCIFGVTKK
mgnify:CR=1 FL=1